MKVTQPYSETVSQEDLDRLNENKVTDIALDETNNLLNINYLDGSDKTLDINNIINDDIVEIDYLGIVTAGL